MDHNEHICSLVVSHRSANCDAVREHLATIPGAETAPAESTLKSIVVLEAETESRILEVLDEISRIDGVLDTHMVYHHCEDTLSLNQVMSDENHPS